MKRESYLQFLRDVKDIHLIKVVTGLRRSGKSTLLLHFCDELKAQDAGRVLYYNLEEKENAHFTKDPDALYHEIIKSLDSDRRNYIFIDEVQMVPDFERMLDSLFVKPNVDLYVTGSNAYMLSSDIATLLTGRYLEVKMQPLTFSEYTQFFPNLLDRIQLFQQFMRYGGLPEVANMLVAGAVAEIPQYLQGVYSTIMEKDIKKRRDIRNMDDFRCVALYSFDNLGNITSPNNIANVLKNDGLVIDRATVESYLASMADCFLLYPTSRYDIRGKNLLRTLEKYYSVDLGLVDALLGRPAQADLGHRLENLVFLELKKRYSDVKTGKNYNKEIDFVVRNHAGDIEYFQVTQTLSSPAVLDRELSALKNTGDNYRKTILSLNPLDHSENGILCRNLIDWLLSPQ